MDLKIFAGLKSYKDKLERPTPLKLLKGTIKDFYLFFVVLLVVAGVFFLQSPVHNWAYVKVFGEIFLMIFLSCFLFLFFIEYLIWRVIYLENHSRQPRLRNQTP